MGEPWIKDHIKARRRGGVIQERCAEITDGGSGSGDGGEVPPGVYQSREDSGNPDDGGGVVCVRGGLGNV